MKKCIALIFCLLFLAVPCSFAGDDFIFAPVADKPGLVGVDSYVISGDNGSEVFHVMSLDPVNNDGTLLSVLVVSPT